MENKNRKTFTGVVVSDKTEKTITVNVDIYKKHPLYGKRMRQSKKFHAHDENQVAKIGDVVSIMESRPYSKTKKFVLVNVIESKEE